MRSPKRAVLSGASLSENGMNGAKTMALVVQLSETTAIPESKRNLSSQSWFVDTSGIAAIIRPFALQVLKTARLD
jgi:hypothetical protein